MIFVIFNRSTIIPIENSKQKNFIILIEFTLLNSNLKVTNQKIGETNPIYINISSILILTCFENFFPRYKLYIGQAKRGYLFEAPFCLTGFIYSAFCNNFSSQNGLPFGKYP